MIRSRLCQVAAPLMSGVLFLSGCVTTAPLHLGEQTVSARASQLTIVSRDTSRFPQPKGSVALIHGLNNRVEALNNIAAGFRGRGFDSIQVTLPGHGDSKTLERPLEEWVSATKAAFDMGRQLTDSGKLIVVGYSLGGVLALLTVQEELARPPDKIILIAPALTLKFPEILLNLAKLPIVNQLPIPSLTPRDDRRWCSVPAKWYGELRDAQSLLDYQRLKDKKLSVSIVAAADDEVVSLDQLREIIKEYKLSTDWVVHDIPEALLSSLTYKHHLINKKALGDAGWSTLLGLVCADL